MKEGKIYDIVWDNSCSGCKKDQCQIFKSYSIYNESNSIEIKNCFLENNKCKDNSESTVCDPKFYITWFGTDKNKRQLQSSSLAMSKFKRYSTSSLYNSIIDIFNNTKGNMEQQWNDISNSIHEILNLLNNF